MTRPYGENASVGDGAAVGTMQNVGTPRAAKWLYRNTFAKGAADQAVGDDSLTAASKAIEPSDGQVLSVDGFTPARRPWRGSDSQMEATEWHRSVNDRMRIWRPEVRQPMGGFDDRRN